MNRGILDDVEISYNELPSWEQRYHELKSLGSVSYKVPAGIDWDNFIFETKVKRFDLDLTEKPNFFRLKSKSCLILIEGFITCEKYSYAGALEYKFEYIMKVNSLTFHQKPQFTLDNFL